MYLQNISFPRWFLFGQHYQGIKIDGNLPSASVSRKFVVVYCPLRDAWARIETEMKVTLAAMAKKW